MPKKIQVVMVPPPGEDLPIDPKDILGRYVNPEIEDFEKYFSERAGGGRLAPFEKEVIRAFLWFKLKGEDDGGR